MVEVFAKPAVSAIIEKVEFGERSYFNVGKKIMVAKQMAYLKSQVERYASMRTYMMR